MNNLEEIPNDLPRPLDDGLCDHLNGMLLPTFKVQSSRVDLESTAQLKSGNCLLFFYPMTGRPDTPLPDGWDGIAGARGCTPENLGFARTYQDISNEGYSLYGVSSQSLAYQEELRCRLGLPFDLVSDEELLFSEHLNAPIMGVGKLRLYKRFTLVLSEGVIEKVFYPIFPPDAHSDEVLHWIRSRKARI